jgi:hypothetical protein
MAARKKGFSTASTFRMTRREAVGVDAVVSLHGMYLPGRAFKF